MAVSSRPTRNCQFFKTKRCKFEFLGMCEKGQLCPFAHGSTELRPLPDLRCTKMCRELLQSGRCSNTNCAYAHSREEIRALGDRQNAARRTKAEGRKPNATVTQSATPALAFEAAAGPAAAVASSSATPAALASAAVGKGAWNKGQQRRGAEREQGHATQKGAYAPGSLGLAAAAQGATLSLTGQGSQGPDTWSRATASSGNVPYPSGLTAGWLQLHGEEASNHLLSEFPSGPAYISLRPAIAEAGLSTESAAAQSWASSTSGPAPGPNPASGSGTARRETNTLGTATEHGATNWDEELNGSDMWPGWSSWSPWGGSWDSQAAGSQGNYAATLSSGSIDVNQQEGGAWSQDWSGLLRASTGHDSKAPQAPIRPVRSSQTTLCTLTDQDSP